MIISKPQNKKVRRWCLALTLTLGGCREDRPARPPDPGTWRVVAVTPAAGLSVPTGEGGAIAPMVLDLDGPAGYVRATVTVERPGPDPGPKGELYDVLFPTPGRLRLVASVEPSPAGAGRARVRFRAESGKETSESVVEPTVPLLAADASVTTEGLIAAGWPTPGGREVELGRWVIQTGARQVELGKLAIRTGGRSTRVLVRVLPSREPTGPRLKPEGKPPA